LFWGPLPSKGGLISKFTAAAHKTATYELLDGFSNGFKIKYSGPRLALETKNLKSVFINPTVALQKVENEIHLGIIAWHFISFFPIF
jgi:hypothetical protein